jgi:hypothetical protein
MPKFACRQRHHRHLAVTVALAALTCLPMAQLFDVGAAGAQDAFDLSVPKPDAEEEVPDNMECASAPVSGSGPGFSSSRDESEEVAIEAWLKKAQAVYPEATFDTAKDSDLSCAVQGLYSKCFATGVPCRPKPE